MILCNAGSQQRSINFNKAIFPGIQGGPLMHVIAAKAVCFKEALQPEFKVYQKNDRGQCTGTLQGSDEPRYQDRFRWNRQSSDVSRPYQLRTDRKRSGKTVRFGHITANKNTIPNDPQSPFVTSGVRLGTPAATSRGLNTEDMDKVAEAIAIMIKNGESGAEQAKAIVKELTDKYPLK